MDAFLNRLDRILGVAHHPASEAPDGVQYWRRRVLDVAMVVGLALGTLSVIPGVIRAALEGKIFLLVADVAVLVIAAVVLLGRRASYGLRAGALVAASFGIGLVQLITSGMNTPGPLWLMVAPVLAAILFNLRAALAMIVVLLLVILGQAAADPLGLLPPALALEVGSPRWVEISTDLILLTTVVSLFMGVLLEGLKSSFDDARRISQDLEEERTRLLETNQELEQQISRRRRAEDERAMLATAMSQAHDGVAIMSADGVLSYVNESFDRLFDRHPDTLLGATLAELELFVDPDLPDRIDRELEKSGVWAGRLRAFRQGEEWEAQASFSVLRDRSGAPTRRLAVIRDVSREAALEAQLAQSQKMQAIGTFAGGIAHDFNNLLVPILGTAELLREELDGLARDQLDDIVRSARRGKALVSQILAFSRGAESRESCAQVSAVVEDVERLLRASLPANIELRLELEDPGPVAVSDVEVQQVLMNLCTNAFYAMRQDGGTLTVRVDAVRGATTPDPAGVATAQPDPGADYVRLTVTDTGVGMDQGTLSRVFEPFFTTKPSGEGTGLGMAMVHGVARSADGVLAIHSEPGRGTEVQVLLPRGSEERPEAARPPEVRQGSGQRVLVVDDEEPVRTVLGRFLERLGYQPVLAGPEDARDLVQADASSLDALITDLSMPGVDGLELGRAFRHARPGMPTILVSGLVDASTLRDAEAAGFDRVLPKPFDMTELSDAMAAVLT